MTPLSAALISGAIVIVILIFYYLT